MLEVHFAVRQVAHQIKASRLATLQDCAVLMTALCSASDVMMRMHEVPNGTTQREVVCFRSARGEIDATGMAVEVLRHPTAALFDQYPRLAANGMA